MEDAGYTFSSRMPLSAFSIDSVTPELETAVITPVSGMGWYTTLLLVTEATTP